MIQNKKRIISLILMLTLLVSALVVGAVTASAAEKKTYSMITSANDLTDGEYVIVSSNGYALTTYDSTGWVLVEKVDAPEKALSTWTIKVDGSTVTLTDANGTSIKPKSGNNNGIQTGLYSWSFSYSNKGFQFMGTGSDTTTLALNSGSQYKARAYKNTTVNGNATSYPSYFTMYKVTTVTACDHPNTKLVMNGNKTHNIVCTNSACNAVVMSNVACSAKAGFEANCQRGFVCDCGYTDNALAPENHADGCSCSTAHTHDYKLSNTIPATCTLNGYKTYTCSCEESYDEVIPAGHSYDGVNCTHKKPDGLVIGAYAEEKNWDDATRYSIDYNGKISIFSNTAGNNGKYYDSGKDWRFYQNNDGTITFTAKNNEKIQAIEITYTSINGGVLKNGEEYVGSNYTLTVNANSISLIVDKIGTYEDGAQVRITSISVVYCDHTNAITERKDATCTVNGYTKITCDCGYNHTEVHTAPGHIYVDGKCSICCEKKLGWMRVDEISELTLGDQIIIVGYKDKTAFALSTTQNNNNRGQIQVELSNDKIIINQSVQIIILDEGTKDGTFAFKVGTNYLYAASSSSNYLRSGTKSDNASWKIESNDGVITIKAQGGYTRNQILYNHTNGIFSCYEGLGTNGQMSNIEIYKYYNGGFDHAYEDSVTVDPTCTAPGVITYTCSTCGDSYTEAIPALGHDHENCPHVACVGSNYYSDLQEAVDVAAAAGGDVRLIKDVVLTEKQITVTSGELVIYLDGHNITAEYSGDVVEVLLVSGTGVVNIEGDGKLYSKTPADRSNCVVSAIDGGQVYIYGGEYVSSGCAVIYATRGGHIKISDGYFKAEVPYDVDGRYYVLDFNEAETNGFGTIAVTGGTFVKFNPANHSNDGKDYTNKVVEGYVVKAVGDNYTVVELDDISGEAIVGDTYYETLQDAIADAAAGSEIVLNNDIEVVGDLTIENQVTINLNGKTLTAGAVVTFFEGTQFIGEGKLEVAKNSLYNIKGETDYVPVWNEAGYYTFSEVKDQVKKSTVEDTEVVVFRPAFENAEIKNELADGAVDNGISFVINITWGTDDNAVSKEYTLSEELIAEIYSQKKAIQLGFENWQAGVEYTVTLRIVSGGIYYETTLCTMKDGAITVPEIVTE